MKIHQQTLFNKIGKMLARPLSHLVANSLTYEVTRLVESYLCILMGKGAGTGWALDAEIKAATMVIRQTSPVIFDVGANTGEWSTLIYRLYPDAKIFLFEPQPECQKEISERNIPNAILIPYAVSSASGEIAKLFSRGQSDGIASLYQRRDSYFCGSDYGSIDVGTVSIDDIVAENNLQRVDFMKMDIEGHEIVALEGARSSLQKGTIKALSFEFGSGNINSRTFFHDFWDFLTPLGYRIYRILPSGRLALINEYYEDCEYFRGVTNYVAILSQNR